MGARGHSRDLWWRRPFPRVEFAAHGGTVEEKVLMAFQMESVLTPAGMSALTLSRPVEVDRALASLIEKEHVVVRMSSDYYEDLYVLTKKGRKTLGRLLGRRMKTLRY